MQTFKDFTEGWVFCGYRILLYKWERAIVVAKTPDEFTILGRMAAQMRSEMVREKLNIPDEIILQTAGDRYAGPLIAERFQVMESFTPRNTFYIADHYRDDLLVRVQGPGSDVKRFPSIEAAEGHIKAFTNTQIPNTVRRVVDHPGAVSGDDGTQETIDMARSPKANADAIKAAAVADKKIGVKAAAKAADADKQMKAAVASATPAKVNGVKPGAKTAAPEATPAKGIKSVEGRGRTIASAFRELIAKPGKLTDEQIHEKVETEFGKKIAKNAVGHYRADLERRQAAGKAA